MCKCDTNFFIMPSPRKRIGFLPSKEVHEIIDKLCKSNEISQSKVTGLLVEEALRSRGVLNESFGPHSNIKNDFINFSFAKETFSKEMIITKTSLNENQLKFTYQKQLISDLDNKHKEWSKSINSKY